MGVNRWKTVVATMAATLLVLILLGVAFIFSGMYNVAATEPHSALASWVLGETQERSIAARGADVAAMPALDSALLAHGFEHFHAMCVECHGAPGQDPGEYGQGLNPEPPELSEEAEEFSDGELFWITKHGIKFTGMPAFGPTHSDEELWAIVGFVRRLEELGPDGYARLVAAAEAAGDSTGAGHSHPPGTQPHSH